jgi:hypothetical protein
MPVAAVCSDLIYVFPSLMATELLLSRCLHITARSACGRSRFVLRPALFGDYP